MAKRTITIKCPFCGIHHVPKKKGSKRIIRGEYVDGQEREFTFEKVNPQEDAFISIREARGRGEGFVEVGRIPIREVVEKNFAPELISSLENQCKKILEIIKK